MKIIFYTLLFVFSSCASQDKFLKDNRKCDFDNQFLRITEKEKKFNKNKHDSILNIQPSYVIETNNLITAISKNRIDKKDLKSNFSKFLVYYPSGAIKYYYNYVENTNSYQLKIGEQIYYDENSKITKTVDFEKGYNICWSEALEIVKKIAKKDIKKNNIIHFIISRSELTEKPKWTISLIPKHQDKDEYTDNYAIDGVTGELIGKYKVRTIHDEVD